MCSTSKSESGELSKSLRHKTSLQTHAAVSDLSLDFGTGNKGRNAVYDNGVNGVGAHKHIADFKRLLACVGLGNEDFVDVNPKTGRIGRDQVHARRR